jgi:hypothetical protein
LDLKSSSMNPKAMKGNLSPPAIALIGELYSAFRPIDKNKTTFCIV